VSPQLYAAGNGAEAIALAADGRRLYVINESWVFRDMRMQGLPTAVTRVDTERMQAATSVDVDPKGSETVTQAIVTRDDQTLYVVDGTDLVPASTWSIATIARYEMLK
jgi:hypothetical protein